MKVKAKVKVKVEAKGQDDSGGATDPLTEQHPPTRHPKHTHVEASGCLWGPLRRGHAGNRA